MSGHTSTPASQAEAQRTATLPSCLAWEPQKSCLKHMLRESNRQLRAPNMFSWSSATAKQTTATNTRFCKTHRHHPKAQRPATRPQRIRPHCVVFWSSPPQAWLPPSHATCFARLSSLSDACTASHGPAQLAASRRLVDGKPTSSSIKGPLPGSSSQAGHRQHTQ